jgi:hypothetical protein
MATYADVIISDLNTKARSDFYHYGFFMLSGYRATNGRPYKQEDKNEKNYQKTYSFAFNFNYGYAQCGYWADW